MNTAAPGMRCSWPISDLGISGENPGMSLRSMSCENAPVRAGVFVSWLVHPCTMITGTHVPFLSGWGVIWPAAGQRIRLQYRGELHGVLAQAERRRPALSSPASRGSRGGAADAAIGSPASRRPTR